MTYIFVYLLMGSGRAEDAEDALKRGNGGRGAGWCEGGWGVRGRGMVLTVDGIDVAERWGEGGRNIRGECVT